MQHNQPWNWAARHSRSSSTALYYQLCTLLSCHCTHCNLLYSNCLTSLLPFLDHCAGSMGRAFLLIVIILRGILHKICTGHGFRIAFPQTTSGPKFGATSLSTKFVFNPISKIMDSDWFLHFVFRITCYGLDQPNQSRHWNHCR